MTKILISVLVAFALGFFSSRIFFNSAGTQEKKDFTGQQCTNLADAKTSLISISQNEYLEYAKIKDLKQKYEKADELLGKIMLLFLADVGFRLQKPVSSEAIVTSGDGAKNPEPVTKPANNVVSSVGGNPAAPTPSPVDPGLIGKSSLIKALATEKQVDDVLDKSLIENPKMELAKGTAPSLRQIKMLDGRYMGTIKFLDTKRESLSVVWDLSPDYSKSELAGSFNLNIHGPGMNSESSGTGSIDKIVTLAEDKDGFLVTGCGGDCYLQLYYNTPTDQFYGNFYQSGKGSTKFSRTGLVDLKK